MKFLNSSEYEIKKKYWTADQFYLNFPHSDTENDQVWFSEIFLLFYAFFISLISRYWNVKLLIYHFDKA